MDEQVKETKARKREPLTAPAALEFWAMRVTGDSLKDPSKSATFGVTGPDDEKSVCDYVQAVDGYAQAKKVLVKVHVDGVRLERVWIQKPGESLVRAYRRLRWIGMDHMKREDAVKAVYRDFLMRLMDKLIEQPWEPPDRCDVPEKTGGEIGEEAGAELEAKVRQIRGRA